MMTLKSILFTFLLFLHYNLLFSQVSGYLGKRLFVNLNMAACPALEGPTASNGGYGKLYGNAEKSFDITTKFGCQVGYAISRRSAITFSGEYFKTGLVTYLKTPSISGSSFNAYDEHYLFYNLNGYTFDFGIQNYKLQKGAIAPMGKYFSYNFFVTSVTGTIVDKRTDYYDPTVNNHAKLGLNPTYITGGLGLEWGQNQIISDKILLNFALRFNLTLGVLRVKDFDKGVGSLDVRNDYVAYNEAVFKLRAAERILNHSLFMVKIGVGILK